MNNQDLQTFLNIIDGRIKKYINENKLLKQYCAIITGFVENNNFTKYKARLLGDEEEFVFLNKTGESLKIGDFVYIQTVGTDLNTGVIIYKTQESLGDFIIEQGTTGIWTWEKWASGKAVCWGNVDVYYQDVNKLTTTVDFPFEIIGDIFAQVTKIAGTDAYDTLYATTCYEATSTQIIIALCNSGEEFGGSDTLKLSVYVIGKWK